MIMNDYNYFTEVNPDYEKPDFDLKKRKDPEYCSKKLIDDLSTIFLANKNLPCGNSIKLIGIEKTRDENRRWYAKIQLYDKTKNYICTLGITSDYIGASVNWGLEAGLSKDKIIKHLLISRTICGHIIFPTWYATKSEQSWKLYPEGISINMAKGGQFGYYDRIDLTLLAIKHWYSIPQQDGKLFETLKKNKIWFDQFCDFEQYTKYFRLEGLLKNKDNIVDLTSYNPETKTYDRVIGNDTPISIPQNEDSYNQYIKGCNRFILSRAL